MYQQSEIRAMLRLYECPEEGDWKIDLRTAFATLDPHTQAILSAVEIYRFPQSRVARHLGVHQSTVSRTIAEGLCQMTSYLNRSSVQTLAA